MNLTNRELSIILRLRDQATAAFKRASTLWGKSLVRLKAAAAAAMKALKLLAAAGVAAVTAAMVMGLRQAGRYMLELDRLNKVTGVSVERLGRLIYAMEQEHGTREGMEKGLVRMTTVLGEAGRGMGRYTDLFDTLGIAYRDNEGRLITADDLMMKLADRFHKGAMTTEELAAAQRLLGDEMAKKLIPFLKLGREHIETLGDEAERLGVIVGEDTVRAAKRFDDEMTKVRAGIRGVWLGIKEELLPHLERLTIWIAENMPKIVKEARQVARAIVDWIEKWKNLLLILGATAAITTVTALLAALGTTIGKLIVSVGKLTTAFKTLWATLLGKIGIIATLLALVGKLAGEHIYAKRAAEELARTNEILVKGYRELLVAKGACEKVLGEYNRRVESGTDAAIAYTEALKRMKEIMPNLTREQDEAVKSLSALGAELSEKLRRLAMTETEIKLEELERWRKAQEEALVGAYRRYLMAEGDEAEVRKKYNEFQTMLEKLHEAKRLGIFADTIALRKKLMEEYAEYGLILAENMTIADLERMKITLADWRKHYELEKELNMRLLELTEGRMVAEMYALTDHFSRLKKKYPELIGLLNEVFIKEMDALAARYREHGETMKHLAKTTAEGMQDAMGTFFFDAITRQLKTTEDYMRAFGQMMARMLADLLARKAILALFGAEGGIFPAVGRLIGLSGGGRIKQGQVQPLPHAQEGAMVARGRAMPIIAHEGEWIGTPARLAAAGIGREQPPARHYTFNIQAMDVRSFQEYMENNRDDLANILMGAIDDNHPARRA